MNGIDALFRPRSVAILGASTDRARIGGRPVYGLRVAGFAGPVYPVNPKYGEVAGYPCYPALEAVPGDVDLALVALPAAQIPAALAQCVAKRVRAASIFSSGFAELGGASGTIEADLARAARAAGVRLLGPNCMGTMNPALGFIGTFTSTIGDHAPEAGPVSVASQSGAFGAHVFTLLRRVPVGIDLWATTGNQADVEIADCIEYMAHSARTRVIAVCVEGVRDGVKFARALATAAAHGKPVVVLKLGRSAVGAAAVASHTAALAGSDAVFDAVLKAHGAYRAQRVDEFVEVVQALGLGRRPAAPTLGIASVSGGFGVLMADAAADLRLALPPLPAAAQARLRALVPFAATRNPLDLTAQFINEPALVEPMLDAVLDAADYGSLLLFIGAAGDIPALIDRLLPGLVRVAQRHGDRVLALCGLTQRDTRMRLQQAGFLVFEDPTLAVMALAALAHRGGRPSGVPDSVTEVRPAPPLLAAMAAPAGPAAPTTLDEWEAKALLRAAGIGVVEGRVARSTDEAVEAARALGYPVAMKVLSAAITHKTDVGGVRLDLADDAAVRSAHAGIVADVRARAGLAVGAVLVERMARGGVELILGVQRDPVFGPVVLVGLGGIHVETLADTALRVCPIDADGAHAMLRELKGFGVLAGARGDPLDVAALAETLARLSRFACDHAADIASVDINPYLLTRTSGVALDAVIVRAPRLGV